MMSRLHPGLVVYQFLRHKDKLKINRNDYSFNCIGKQAIDAEYNIILEGVPAKVMSKDEVAIFEKTIKTFLNDAIKSSLDADGDVEVLAVKKKKNRNRESYRQRIIT
mmetsp:Transcript_8397/g.12344  ORF Transcript_8397/g.12344 Transcript_8397/m.12344 type:complete len:107 (-) Transcript_8397:592-912(-)